MRPRSSDRIEKLGGVGELCCGAGMRVFNLRSGPVLRDVGSVNHRERRFPRDAFRRDVPSTGQSGQSRSIAFEVWERVKPVEWVHALTSYQVARVLQVPVRILRNISSPCSEYEG